MTITRRELIAASAGLAAYLTASASAGAQDANRPSVEALLNDLVTANHFLAQRDVFDGYGHVSVRHPASPERYLMARSVAPALVTAADILTYDLDSNPINANGAHTYIERYIHGEIYKARPGVEAVVHAHSAALVSFGVTGIPLRPIAHNCGFVGAGVPIFEIREAREPNDKAMLVHTPALGKALARTLGDHPAALMRGHGGVIVGSSLGQAVARTIYLERNALIQAQAMALGSQINYLDADEARSMGESTYDRDWEVWRKQQAT